MIRLAHATAETSGLELPLEVVTQTTAIVAKRRAGKSYLARRIAESVDAAGQQLVVIDPKGDWWGIRTAADGVGRGRAIVIIGGEHGDLPLQPDAGELVARLVVERRVSAVLDLSSLRKHEVATFCAVFLETLYRLKAREAHRTALLLIIDEADAIAPQKPAPNEARMLGAASDIVRRGGQRGIGCMLITQRTAVLSKDLLTQAQILIALRTIAPQDLKAMQAWIDVHGGEVERAVLMDSLPSLPVGDAWVWSPGWPTDAGIFARIHTAPIETFDSGRTPKPGERLLETRAVALDPAQLEAVRQEMADAIEQARADDPKVLRARIAELERGGGPTPEPLRVEVPRPVFTDDDRAALGRVEQMLTHTASELARLGDLARVRIERSPPMPPSAPAVLRAKSSVARAVAGVVESAAANGAVKVPASPASTAPADGRTAILTCIAQHGARGVTRDEITILTGYKRSRRNVYLDELRNLGFATEAEAGWVATDHGVRVLGPSFKPLPTGAKLRQHYESTLDGGELVVFRAACQAYPNALDRTDVTEYARSRRNVYIQRLIARRLVTESGRGVIRAAEALFR